MKDSTLQDLKSLHEQAQQARSAFESAWYLNLAFYQGQQWSYYAGGRLYRPKMPDHRVMFVDNRIIGIIRTEIAKMTKNRPVWVATPTSGEDEDVTAALTLERVLDWYWNEHRLQRRLANVLRWARICSAGFWKVYWDSQEGETVKVLAGPDGQPIETPSGVLRADDPQVEQFMQAMPPEAMQQVQTVEVAQGDVCVEVKSPFEILPDPLAEEGGLDEAEWLVEESVRSEAYVKDRYNVDIQPDADAVSGIAESRMGGGSAMARAGTYKGVRIYEYWKARGSSDPEGKRVVWAKDQVLYEGPNPYDCLPYVMFSGVPVPGRFWPTSTVEQLRSPQAELNKTRSQIRENAARLGNPSLLASKMAHVEYSGIPGEVVRYDPTMPDSVPAYLQPPEMPVYVLQEPDRINESMREISGQHEVTQGQVPTGVTAASAINLLMEQDETRLGPDVAEMELSLAHAGSMIAKLVARYYTDERTVRIVGEDGAFDVFDFKGEQLRGNTQVEVQAGSAFPRSKAAKQAAMQELLSLVIQYGVDINPRDLRKFFKDYEVGGLERLFSSLGNDEAQINRENRQMSMGAELGINSFDDDEAHLDAHSEYMKAARFERFSDQVKQIFEGHTMLHRQRLVAAQDAAAAAAAEAEAAAAEMAAAAKQNGGDRGSVRSGSAQ